MTPGIDVVCAAYDAEPTLAETLASIAAQTLPAARVIVVDDGSTDGTAALAEVRGAEVLRRPHAGVAAAQNAGIAASRADLLAFIDADDLWPQDKLAQQARLLAESDADGVLGLFETFACPTLAPERRAQIAADATLQPAWLTGALLVRRAAFDRVGGFDEGLAAGHAIDWFDRARRAGLTFLVPPVLVLRRRIRERSLSHRTPGRDAAYVALARRAISRRRTGGEGGEP